MIDPIDGLVQRTFEKISERVLLAAALGATVENVATSARIVFPNADFAGTQVEMDFVYAMILFAQGMVNEGLKKGYLVDVTSMAVVPDDTSELDT